MFQNQTSFLLSQQPVQCAAEAEEPQRGVILARYCGVLGRAAHQVQASSFGLDLGCITTADGYLERAEHCYCRAALLQEVGLSKGADVVFVSPKPASFATAMSASLLM